MKTYLQMDGDKLVEYVEKREYDALSLLAHELATLRAEDMATINDLRKQLQDAMEALKLCAAVIGSPNDGEWKSVDECNAAFNSATEVIRAVKGEQP